MIIDLTIAVAASVSSLSEYLVVAKVIIILWEECGVNSEPCSLSQFLSAGYIAGNVRIAGPTREDGGYILANAAFTCSPFKFPSVVRLPKSLTESINPLNSSFGVLTGCRCMNTLLAILSAGYLSLSQLKHSSSYIEIVSLICIED